MQLSLIFFGHVARDHAVGVELPPLGQVGDAAGHPGTGVPSHRTERDGDAAGHVLTEMVARAFDHGSGARVAHAETLADSTGHEQTPAGRAVADRVAREHRVRRRVVCKRTDHDHAAAHAFAHVVLRFTFERELHALIDERAEALARAAAVVARLTGGECGAHRALRVVDCAGRRRGRRGVAVAGPLAATWKIRFRLA